MEQNKKLKIAVFTDSFYPGVGGTESAVFHLANALKNLNYDIMVCAPTYYQLTNNDNYNFVVNRCKSKKVTDNYYNGHPNISKEFIKKLNDFKPDIIHCHTNGAMLVYGIKYARKNNIPIISTIHTKFSMTIKNDIHSNFLTKICCKVIGSRLKKCDRVTAVSQSMDKEFALYGYKGQFDVIKNGTTFSVDDVKNVDKQLAQKQYGLTDKDNILLFVGHVSKVKNIDFIFKSLQILNDKSTNFKMMFVGSIDDKKFYNMVINSELKNKIIFTDNIKNKQLLSSIYLNSKLFLFPSTFDTDGLVVCEAAQMETPSLVLDGYGPSERITNNVNGFIINDELDMAEKINYLLNNQDVLKKVGHQASVDLPKNWNFVATLYIDVYKKVIENYKKIRR